jgi:nicotinate dehydrogenase subunit A
LAPPLTLNVNGADRTAAVDPETPLLYVLRHDLALLGTKPGCSRGQCGACTVLMDGKSERSCITPVHTVLGKQIVTIDGLGTPEDPHPLQSAFIELQAAQCGYCIPGIITTAAGLLDHNPNPSRAEIVDALQENLCRCGTHTRIQEAIELAVDRS